MPRVIVTEGATEGLEKCRRFLFTKAPEGAKRASLAIARQLLLLETAPTWAVRLMKCQRYAS